jgi:hypothetical protein
MVYRGQKFTGMYQDFVLNVPLCSAACLLTYLLTIWSQEILRILWNPKFH